MPQHFALYEDLSVWANVDFAASIYYGMPLRRTRRMKEVLSFVELLKHRSKAGAASANPNPTWATNSRDDPNPVRRLPTSRSAILVSE